MITPILTTAIFFLAAAPQTLPTHTTPTRNTFLVAAETVIDNADAVDLKADDAHFEPQMKELKSAKDNLSRMADDDRERDIAAAINDLVFAINACHIRAKDGASTARCETQVANARNRTMSTLNKHKSNGTWLDGPPA